MEYRWWHIVDTEADKDGSVLAVQSHDRTFKGLLLPEKVT